MSLINRAKRLWMLSAEPRVTVPIIQTEDVPDVPVAEPWQIFPCTCKEQVKLFPRLEPGQAAVIACDNCGESWSVFLPSIVLRKTEEFPEVWKHTSEKVSDEQST